MTPEQSERWKDFAIRMARNCFLQSRRPDAQWIEEAVLYFFETSIPEEDVCCIVSWDHSEPYPAGHECRRALRTYHCPCAYFNARDGKKASPTIDCRQCGGTGLATEWAKPGYLCDRMSLWEDDYIYYSLHCICTEGELRWYRELRRYDDEAADEVEERIVEHWADPVRCCVRAGLGAAIDGGSGMGVLGFTARDIRRMYPEGVPDWIARQWDGGERVGASAVIPGVGFVPEVTGPSERFEDMADATELWL